MDTILEGRPSWPGIRAGWEWVQRLSPRLGWDTFLIVVALVGVPTWSLREADWVQTPGLLWIAFLSALTGMGLAGVKRSWPWLHLAGLTIGFVVVIWQASSLMESAPLWDQVREVLVRLETWHHEAVSGGISTDLLPFTVAMLSLTWLLGYFSSWFLFRRGNVWVAIVFSGMALLTNLSFLPDGFDSRFFVYVFLAMLLVIRVGVVQRGEQWQAAKLNFSTVSGRGAVAAATLLSVALLTVVALLPLKVYVSRTAVDIWNFSRTPVAGLEEDFARLFSGIESRKGLSGRYFGKALPFQGRVSFKSEPVLWASTQNPTYWLSRTYSEYTPLGWIAGETEELEVGPQKVPPPPQESANRDLVVHNIQVAYDTSNLFVGGQLDIISHSAVLQTLKPQEFEIDLLDNAQDSDLPPSIQKLAERMRNDRQADTGRYTVPMVLRTLPRDVVLIGPDPGDDNRSRSTLDKVKLQRKAPTIPDVVSWRFADVLPANDSYTMGAYVSNAGEDELRAAGENYGGFIEDHYLQLPDELPQRVRDLSAELTQGARTPIQKALVIQDYLRGGEFDYSKRVEAPRSNEDAVDRFLFETKKGYSDYFASAMAVLLRSAGVPARMAAGYAQGAEDQETGRLMVKGSDSHGWTQVYFPGHGWIDFEPTPRWEAPDFAPSQDLDFGAFELPELEEDFIINLPYECYFPEIFDSFVMYTEMCRPDGVVLGPAAIGASDTTGWRLSSLVVPAAAAVIVALGVLGAAVWFVWTKGLGNSGHAERVYTRMSRLGTLAGIRRRGTHTPTEYALALGNAIPDVATEASTVALAFSAGRYGGKDLNVSEYPEMMAAWRNVKAGLLKRALRRLVPLSAN